MANLVTSNFAARSRMRAIIIVDSNHADSLAALSLRLLLVRISRNMDVSGQAP